LQIEPQTRKTENVTTDKGGGNLLALDSNDRFESKLWAIAHRAVPTGIDSECIASHVPANPCPAGGCESSLLIGQLF
jgi:hypothetical protein